MPCPRGCPSRRHPLAAALLAGRALPAAAQGAAALEAVTVRGRTVTVGYQGDV